ncbi:MAG: aminotransferase class V-fold PLP-dependent enzyme [Phycisphaeraceae bacterium]
MNLTQILTNDSLRHDAFPVTAHPIYLAHAGVCPLPAVARDAMIQYAHAGSIANQETDAFVETSKLARKIAAQLIGATACEIALIGPTSLGLNLVALGLDFQPGDQVIYYADDYPANTYCWMNLVSRGVQPVPLRTAPDRPGVITWSVLEPLLTDRTRLVSLATCNYLSGYRIDYADIGRRLHERGILFCLDAIQTLGAFPLNVEHVDFLAADSHKWLLGPLGAGIFYANRKHWPHLRPALLGSWNVVSPRFISQPTIDFVPGGQRFEPGALNAPGIVAMAAAMHLLLDIGIDNIAARLLQLRRHLVAQLTALGFEPYLSAATSGGGLADIHNSAIVTVTHPTRDLKSLFDHLKQNNVIASLRHNRAGTPLLRFSPHFYITENDLDRAVALIKNV